jgi:hypothetical protein
MRSRIFFLSIVAFWLAMNYLLWRSQWGAHSAIGSAVPAEVVWDKILTAPDPSSLNIYDHDKKVGMCHWIATVGNSPLASNKILDDDYAPDGQEEQVTGYSLTFEGNATVSRSNQIRFEASLNLSTNRAWQDFHLRVSERPRVWEIRAAAAAEKLFLKVDDKNEHWQKTLNFADLRDPDALWADVGGAPVLALLAGAAGLAPSKESLSRLTGAVEWEAHEDWMQFGHSKARAYRLETVFLGRHIYLFTSRVGEILWVEFPGKITFRNDAFEHF